MDNNRILYKASTSFADRQLAPTRTLLREPTSMECCLLDNYRRSNFLKVFSQSTRGLLESRLKKPPT